MVRIRWRRPWLRRWGLGCGGCGWSRRVRRGLRGGVCSNGEIRRGRRRGVGLRREKRASLAKKFVLGGATTGTGKSACATKAARFGKRPLQRRRKRQRANSPLTFGASRSWPVRLQRRERRSHSGE